MNDKPYKTSPNFPDIITFFTLSLLLIKAQPSVQYLSYRFGLLTTLSDDPLRGAIIGFSTLLLILYVILTIYKPTLLISRIKLSIVCLFILSFIIIPLISDITVRHEKGIKVNGKYFSFVHDGGVLQTEASMRFFLQGVSPYSSDFSKTETKEGMDSDPALWKRLGFEENPALHFFAYPPLTFLLSIPFYLISMVLFGWYDQRLTYLIVLFALCVISYKLPVKEEWRLPLMSLIVLNPMNAVFIVIGTNDMVCLTFIMAAVFLLSRNKLKASSLIIGLSCGIKQFAWILVPFFVIYLYSKIPPGRLTRKIRSLCALTWPLFAVLTATFAPFIIWDGDGLFYGLIVSNGGDYPFRENSLGFSNMLILFNLIESYRDTFPTIALYLSIVAPVTITGLYRVYRDKTISSMVLWYAVVMLLFLYFSRNFAPSYFSLFFSMITVGFMLKSSDEDISLTCEQITNT